MSWFRRSRVSTPLKGKFGKIWKSLKSENCNQNIVMNEEFVQNSVMNATFDPKFLMDLSIFKIGGWNNLTPSKQKLLE